MASRLDCPEGQPGDENRDFTAESGGAEGGASGGFNLPMDGRVEKFEGELYKWTRMTYMYSPENKVYIAKNTDMEVRADNQLELPDTSSWYRMPVNPHYENPNMHGFKQEGPHFVVDDITEVIAVDIDSDEFEREQANLWASEDEYVVTEGQNFWFEGKRYDFVMKDTPAYQQLKKETYEKYPEKVAEIKHDMELKRKEEREKRKAKRAKKRAKKKARKQAAKKAAEELPTPIKESEDPPTALHLEREYVKITEVAEQELVLYKTPSEECLIRSLRYTVFMDIGLKVQGNFGIPSHIGVYFLFKKFTIINYMEIFSVMSSPARRMEETEVAEQKLVLYKTPPEECFTRSFRYTVFMDIGLKVQGNFGIPSHIGEYFQFKKFTIINYVEVFSVMPSVRSRIREFIKQGLYLPMLEEGPADAQNIIPPADAEIVAEIKPSGTDNIVPKDAAMSVEERRRRKARRAEKRARKRAKAEAAKLAIEKLAIAEEIKPSGKDQIEESPGAQNIIPVAEEIKPSGTDDIVPKEAAMSDEEKRRRKARRAEKRAKKRAKEEAAKLAKEKRPTATTECNEVPTEEKPAESRLAKCGKRLRGFGRALARLVICGTKLED